MMMKYKKKELAYFNVKELYCSFGDLLSLSREGAVGHRPLLGSAIDR